MPVLLIFILHCIILYPLFINFHFSNHISHPQIGHPSAPDTRYDIQFQNMNIGSSAPQAQIQSDPGRNC